MMAQRFIAIAEGSLMASVAMLTPCWSLVSEGW